MDGDLAPLPELAELAKRHRCRLMVDEAHATGCIGPGGRGSVAAAGLTEEVDVIIGTLGKALGGYGAYVCGSRRLTDYLLNTARPFIFSTALPPPVVAAASAALELLGRRPRRVKRLRANAAALREGLRAEGLEVGGEETQIVPVIVGEADAAMALCERLLERGVFAQAIRPPTVPPGTCRLRLTAMSTHRVGDLRKAARLIGRTARELGLRGRGRSGGRLGVTGGCSRALRPPPGRVGGCAGSSSPGPAPRSERRWSRPPSPGPRAATGGAGSGLQAGGQRPRRARRRGLADHELLRLAAGSHAERRGDRPLPLRAGGLAAPGGGAGRRANRSRDGSLAAARAAAARADLLVCEGVGGFLVPLAPGYLVRDLARELGLPGRDRRVPWLGTINHTLLTIESVRAAGLEVASVVLTPWPDEPIGAGAKSTATRSPRSVRSR